MESEHRRSKVSMTNVLPSRSTTKSIGKSLLAVGGPGRSMSRLKVRRPSYGFAGIPGVGPVRKPSQVGIEYKRPALMYLPTYQLEPTVPFHVAKVQKATEEILDQLFTGHIYNVQESPATAVAIAGELMRHVKAMGFNRYRIFTVCTIGQRRAQSYNNALCFLWDHERDNYVDVIREVTTAFVQVTTFGVYLD